MVERLDARALAWKRQVVESLKANITAEMALQSLGARLSLKVDGTGQDDDYIFSLLFERGDLNDDVKGALAAADAI
jgi:hypothetical protein